MLKRIIFYLIASAILTAWGTGWGATYYMRADGTAANLAAATGPCDTASACMTIAQHNTAGWGSALSPDDIVYMCDDGGDFETDNDNSKPYLITSANGTDGHRITYRAHTGDTPVIKMAAGANDNYVARIATDYLNIIGITFDVNGTNQTGGLGYCAIVWTGDTHDIEFEDCTFQNSYTGSGNGHGLYVNTTYAGANIEITDCTFTNIYDNSIHADGTNGLTISGCAITAEDTGINIVSSAGSAANISILNNEITNWGAHAGSDNAINIDISGDDLLISGNYIHSPGGLFDCINVNPSGDTQDNIVISNNILAGNLDASDVGIVINSDDATDIVSIIGNSVSNFRNSGIWVHGGQGTISGNYLANNGTGNGGMDNNIAVYSGLAGAYNSTSNGWNIQNNIINGGYDGIYLYGEDADNETNNTDIYNNTIYDTTNMAVFIGDDVNNTLVKNNIISTTDSSVVLMTDDATAASNSVTIDYNLYYSPNDATAIFDANGTTYDTMADWYAATGHDNTTHSIAGSDPTFVSAGSNFHLAVGSPAIDAGTDVSLTEDYDGRAVPYGAGVDMGALEWVRYVLIQKAE